jgi:hypothetical protein
MKIITNNHPRPLACLAELPGKVRAEFDYVGDGDYTARFVQYKGHWYDVYDSQACGVGFDQFKGWDGIVSETFFSGVLFRFADEDQVIVGQYFA